MNVDELFVGFAESKKEEKRVGGFKKCDFPHYLFLYLARNRHSIMFTG